jgi:hypothetical protein
MDESRSVKFLGLLRVLLRHQVDFFVVGGVAAQLEGAPILQNLSDHGFQPLAVQQVEQLE